MIGTNVGATKEPGEPNHAGNSGGKSVWWSWTAPVSGNVSVTTVGSSFDTLLAVYTGTALSNLTGIASNGQAGTQSAVVFNSVSGTTYQIAVDGYFGDSGTISLSIIQPTNVPMILIQPTNQTALLDGTAVFTLAAGDATPLLYQ